MNKRFLLLIVGTAAWVLAGCHGKPVLKNPKGATNPIAIGTNGAGSGGGSQGGANGDSDVGGASGAALNATGNGATAPVGISRLVYFDFDSSEIRPEFVSVIAAHAKALSANASIRVRLEGHSDERGSPEYNIGLGERRAQAVRRALMLQGVAESQLSTVSYGEERPAVAGETEEAWAKNRRVEFIYLN